LRRVTPMSERPVQRRRDRSAGCRARRAAFADSWRQEGRHGSKSNQSQRARQPSRTTASALHCNKTMCSGGARVPVRCGCDIAPVGVATTGKDLARTAATQTKSDRFVPLGHRTWRPTIAADPLPGRCGMAFGARPGDIGKPLPTLDIRLSLPLASHGNLG